MADWHKIIPRDQEGNLEFRLEVATLAAEDPEFAEAIRAACAEDPLFFFNLACWIYEPRPLIINGKKQPQVFPFISWEHQDPAILEIHKHLGIDDIGVEKSRGEGASWMLVYFALHDLLFEPMAAVGLVSKTELDVDNPRNPDSLFWKIDFALKHVPSYLKPPGDQTKIFDRNISKHTLINTVNGANITGFAATGDVGSGGRKKWFGMDELAKFPPGDDHEAMTSVQHVTNSRVIVSTPKGNSGAYYEAMHGDSNMVKIIIDWKMNPTKNRGMYVMKNGVPTAEDPVNNPLPPEYNPPNQDILNMLARLRRKGYKIDNVRRSPWYDRQCDRVGATPKRIAQELDRDYGGSQHRVYSQDFQDAAEKTIKPELLRGDFTYDSETLAGRFEPNPNGALRLWVPLNQKEQPAKGDYDCGADISLGLGGTHTSNSVLFGFSHVTKCQVFEYVSNTINPIDFADLSIALCKWFHDAQLGWEQNGPGETFSKRVLERGYSNVYRRVTQDVLGNRRQLRVGWRTDEKTKGVLHSDLAYAVRTGEVTIYSKQLVQECLQYSVEDGKIVHKLSANSEDDSVKGQSHGDRTVAAGVALQVLKSTPDGESLGGTREKEDYENPPRNTMAWRDKEYRESLERDEDRLWDSRTNLDLAMGASGVLSRSAGLGF